MKINQRDIVEVNFELPNGDFKTHPALVISNQQVLEAEDIFYAVMISTKEYNDEFTFELKDIMLTKPPTSTSVQRSWSLVLNSQTSLQLEFAYIKYHPHIND